MTVVGAATDHAAMVRTFAESDARFPLAYGRRIGTFLPADDDDPTLSEAIAFVRLTAAEALVVVHPRRAALDDEAAGRLGERLDAITAAVPDVEFTEGAGEQVGTSDLRRVREREHLGCLVIPKPRGLLQARRVLQFGRETGVPVLLASGATRYQSIVIPARDSAGGWDAAWVAFDLAARNDIAVDALGASTPRFLVSADDEPMVRAAVARLRDEGSVRGAEVTGRVERANPVRLFGLSVRSHSWSSGSVATVAACCARGSRSSSRRGCPAHSWQCRRRPRVDEYRQPPRHRGGGPRAAAPCKPAAPAGRRPRDPLRHHRRAGARVVHADELVVALGELGFLLLLFLAGFEIDLRIFERSGPRPVLRGTALFGLSLGLAAVAAFALGLGTFATLVLATTSVGLVVPTLRSARALGNPLGQDILIAALIADFATLVIVSAAALVIRVGPDVRLLAFPLFLGLVVAAFTGLRIAAWWWPDPFARFLHAQDPDALGVRFAIAMLLGFAGLAGALGIEPALGAFLGGVGVATVFRSRGELDHTLNGLAYGFLIPIFFIGVGLGFSLTALENPGAIGHALVLTAAALLVKLLPALLVLGGLTPCDPRRRPGRCSRPA